MADIATNMTMVRWLRAKVSNYIDVTDDFIYVTLVGRCIGDDAATVNDVTERQRDLCLADMYYGAAISSVKSGTQGESDGGWTHYVAIKNIANRDALMRMAKALYDKWGEAYVDSTPKIRLKPLY